MVAAVPAKTAWNSQQASMGMPSAPDWAPTRNQPLVPVARLLTTDADLRDDEVSPRESLVELGHQLHLELGSHGSDHPLHEGSHRSEPLCIDVAQHERGEPEIERPLGESVRQLG